MDPDLFELRDLQGIDPDLLQLRVDPDLIELREEGQDTEVLGDPLVEIRQSRRNQMRAKRYHARKNGSPARAVGRPITSSAPRDLHRRSEYRSEKTVEKVRTALGTQYQELLSEAAESKRGSALGLSKNKKTQENSAVDMVKSFIGKFSHNSTFRQGVVQHFSEGERPVVFEKKYDVPANYVNQARWYARQTSTQSQAQKPQSRKRKFRGDSSEYRLFKTAYPPNTKRAKSRSQERIHTMEWLKDQSFMVAPSGSRSDTFKLHSQMNLGYESYVIHQPRILRRLVTDSPAERAPECMRTSASMTILQKNIEAVFAQKLGLSDAMEVSGQLDLTDPATKLCELKNRALVLGLKQADQTWEVCCGVEEVCREVDILMASKKSTEVEIMALILQLVEIFGSSRSSRLAFFVFSPTGK